MSTMSGMCHRKTPKSTIHEPTVPAQDGWPPSSPSASNGSHNAPREPPMAAQTFEDRDTPVGQQQTLTFRVTGAASVARLEPLLLDQDEGGRWQPKWSRAVDDGGDDGSGANGGRIDFVWETTVRKEEVRRHRNARVLNRLSGAQVRRVGQALSFTKYCLHYEFSMTC